MEPAGKFRCAETEMTWLIDGPTIFCSSVSGSILASSCEFEVRRSVR